jgi:eukaryotic-like serine/threonine-protein kinase
VAAPDHPSERPDGSGRRLEPLDQSWDEREAVRAAANKELRGEVLGSSVDRLAGIAGISGLVLMACLLAVLGFARRDQHPWTAAYSTFVITLSVAIGTSVLVFALTRLPKLRAQHAYDIGSAYLFVLSLLLGVLRHSYPWAPGELVRQVSPAVIPILAFAALIPAAPRGSLATLLVAAATDPLALYAMRGREGAIPLAQILLFCASPFGAALVGYKISRVVHHLNEGIERAREIGSYRLVERLGAGGMADVWRADHRMLARPAAVKLIRPGVLDHGNKESERLLRLFLREARATASLSSPHTIQVYDFGITREGSFYYVMELLNGVDLKTLVDRFGPQVPERVAFLLAQVCHSLAEAHDQSFVHRDVKPANIFTCQRGGDSDFVKVLDFGLVLDRHPTAEELEDEKRFVGTPAIMAPEMVRFQAPVDARADLYAVGCVGYWLLTGKRVFEAETRHDMLVMHAHQKPVTPSVRVGRPIHSGLEAIVMACLEKNPDRRPQTARELNEGLAALTFDPPWTEERAALWWKHYQPLEPEETPKPAPVSDTSGATSNAPLVGEPKPVNQPP